MGILRMSLLITAVLFASSGIVLAEEEAIGPEQQCAAAEAMSNSLVRVEYTLQLDKGQEPAANGWLSGGSYSINGLIEQERPLEIPGLLIDERTVLLPDAIIHPRFIKSIEVCFDDQRVQARPAALQLIGTGAFLELAEPLKGAAPLKFDASLKEPYLGISYAKINAEWIISAKPLNFETVVSKQGREILSGCVLLPVVDAKGTPVGVMSRPRLPLNDAWKGSPTDWEKIDADTMERTLAEIEKSSANSIMRVALSFRSPKKDPSQAYRYSYDDEESSTEKNVLGVLLDEKTVLVLTNMPAKVTARLEQITVHRPSAEPVKATFKATLKDYGCFLAELEAPMSGAVKMCDKSLKDILWQLLPAAEIYLQGENRVSYFTHRRINGIAEGWKGRLFPAYPGDENNVFLFQTGGELVALPLTHRDKIATANRYRDYAMTTPVALLKEALDDLENNIDPNNVPLTEEEENRIAWLGVEMQPLDRELARVNLVSDHCDDGNIGGIVSFIYENSPAAKAGIKPGDILLRVHGEDQPKPLDIQVEEGIFSSTPFPWERLDEVPEEYYERIPQPWPMAENAFNRMLTEIGFGKKFSVELFRDGKLMTIDFDAVTESPAHYNAAAKFKSEELGLTVKEMTFEVRRYFRKGKDEPGLIISAIEPGSKASVAGLKPYEQVTDVNDKPVHSVKDFETAIAGQSRLRLAVKRMTTGRVVTIVLDDPKAAEDAAEDDAGATAGDDAEDAATAAATAGAEGDSPAATTADSVEPATAGAGDGAATDEQ